MKSTKFEIIYSEPFVAFVRFVVDLLMNEER
jgi:hypothetical protein